MNRRSLILIFVLLFLAPGLFAQNSRLNGIWVVPTTNANGPSFYTLIFTVTGDTFTGTKAETDHGAESITNGKIENGRVFFSFPKDEMAGVTLERSYTGALKDDKHLDLVEERRTTGLKMSRALGAKTPPDSLEGMWGSDQQTTMTFHMQGEALSGEVVERLFERQNGEVLMDIRKHESITDGHIHGNEFSFHFKNRWNDAVACTGTLAGDHLVLSNVATSPLRAVRVANSVK